MDPLPNPLKAAREGRAAARHLEQLVATRTLTEADGRRLLDRIQKGFDAVLGPVGAPPTPERGPFTVHRGGRP